MKNKKTVVDVDTTTIYNLGEVKELLHDMVGVINIKLTLPISDKDEWGEDVIYRFELRVFHWDDGVELKIGERQTIQKPYHGIQKLTPLHPLYKLGEQIMQGGGFLDYLGNHPELSYLNLNKGDGYNINYTVSQSIGLRHGKALIPKNTKIGLDMLIEDVQAYPEDIY